MHDQEKGYEDVKKAVVDKLKEAVDLLLKEGNDEAYEKIYMLFAEENIRGLCKLDNDLFIVMKMIVLWNKEKKTGNRNNILDSSGDLNEVVELYKNIIFSIYRLEQALPLIYQDEAVQYMAGINISPIVLTDMVEDKVIDKQTFYKNLLEGFYRNGYIMYKK